MSSRKGENPVIVSHPPIKHLRTPMDDKLSLSHENECGLRRRNWHLSHLPANVHGDVGARARRPFSQPKPFRLARVQVRERACARTRTRRGGNGDCAAPSLRYARALTSDCIRIFFPSEKHTKLYKKLFVFSDRKGSEYFCLPIIYRPYIPPLYPLAPSTRCPVYSSICFAALSPGIPLTPFPLSPAPLASGGISTAGVFRFPRNVGRVVAKGGKSRLISPSRFLLLSFISRTTTPFYFRIMSSRLDLQLKCAKSVFFFLSTKKKRYI